MSSFPSLAALSVNNKTRIHDLSGALLSKTLHLVGSVQDMCNAIDALSRASSQTVGVDTWKELAEKYAMPNRPPETAPVGVWRWFVMRMCSLVKPGLNSNGVDNIRFNMNYALRHGRVDDFRWIVSFVGETHFEPEPMTVYNYEKMITQQRLDVRFLQAMSKWRPSIPDYVNQRSLTIRWAIRYNHVEATRWLFSTFNSDVAVAVFEPADLPPDELASIRGRMLQRHTGGFYTDVAFHGSSPEQYQLVEILDELRAVPMKHEYEFSLFSRAAQNRDVRYMRWLDNRYGYTAADAQAVMSVQHSPHALSTGRSEEFMDLLKLIIARGSA